MPLKIVNLYQFQLRTGSQELSSVRFPWELYRFIFSLTIYLDKLELFPAFGDAISIIQCEDIHLLKTLVYLHPVAFDGYTDKS